MLNNKSTNLNRIIAKIDNDFNPDNSDWIPRVGAWVYDALNMLDAIQIEKKRIRIPIKDRFGISSCNLTCDIKLYDKNGCLIKEATANDCKPCNGNIPSTGESPKRNCSNIEGDVTPQTIVRTEDGLTNPVSQAVYVNTKYPPRYNVIEFEDLPINDCRNYVRIGRNKIELNFDTDYVEAEIETVKTENINNCEMPIIPNNGLLIEAIGYYCMYKMLCRGYKHPVFNLAASQYGTNPYFIWNDLKDKAKRSVINDGIDQEINDSDLWQSAFSIYTFGKPNIANNSNKQSSKCGCN